VGGCGEALGGRRLGPVWPPPRGEVMDFLTANWPLLLAGLWAVDRLADVVARLTPNKTDDAWVAKFHWLLEKAASLGIKPAAK
jgi:hypothetical protein